LLGANVGFKVGRIEGIDDGEDDGVLLGSNVGREEG